MHKHISNPTESRLHFTPGTTYRVAGGVIDITHPTGSGSVPPKGQITRVYANGSLERKESACRFYAALGEALGELDQSTRVGELEAAVRLRDEANRRLQERIDLQAQRIRDLVNALGDIRR